MKEFNACHQVVGTHVKILFGCCMIEIVGETGRAMWHAVMLCIKITVFFLTNTAVLLEKQASPFPELIDARLLTLSRTDILSF